MAYCAGSNDSRQNGNANGISSAKLEIISASCVSKVSPDFDNHFGQQAKSFEHVVFNKCNVWCIWCIQYLL